MLDEPGLATFEGSGEFTPYTQCTSDHLARVVALGVRPAPGIAPFDENFRRQYAARLLRERSTP
jgi:hypothetical protein